MKIIEIKDYVLAEVYLVLVDDDYILEDGEIVSRETIERLPMKADSIK